MSVSREILHQIRAAKGSKDPGDVRSRQLWNLRLQDVNSLTAAGILKQTPAEVQVPGQTEPLVLPSSEQLITASQEDMRNLFGREMELSEPPAELFPI